MKQAIISLADGSMTTGKVSNIIEITQEAALGFVLPDNSLLWDCGQYPVAIGDDWNDGVFTREGATLIPLPTVEQQVSQVRAGLSQSDAAALELYEGQLVLQSQIDTALIEMYEAKAN
ncbi:MAG: hypothetical protein VB035_09895 [Candidatus Fimivivens sp.]|nr:hypothetical protein [Candidatus Fimivivens sp.]